MGNVQKTDLDKLAKILCGENNGKIKYLPFLIFLRTLTSTIHEKYGKNNEIFDNCGYDNNQLHYKHNNNSCKIIEQLINNCVDRNGTLLQLRKYLIKNIKNKSSKNDNDNDNNNNNNNNNDNDNNNNNNNNNNINIQMNK